MKPKFPASRIVRLIALACIVLALWPGVVAIDTPLDRHVNGALQSIANLGAAAPAPAPSTADENFTETKRWVIRMGVPLRPFASADWSRTVEGKTNGKVRVTSTESTSSWAYADPMGMLYSGLLIAAGIILLGLSRRQPNADAALQCA